MAAIKLSDKPTVNTVNDEMIPLVLATGAIVKISKTDLAKAMREAFPAATTIGTDDKIPIFQGGADKLLPFHLLSNEILAASKSAISHRTGGELTNVLKDKKIAFLISFDKSDTSRYLMALIDNTSSSPTSKTINASAIYIGQLTNESISIYGGDVSNLSSIVISVS